jgi:DNA-binding beta-propeller fold protein YncE
VAAGLALLALVVEGRPVGGAGRPAAAGAAAAIGPFAFAVAVDARAGHAFVISASMDNRNGGLTGPGRVSVLDARTGTLLRTVTVGLGSGALAVDERTGHAFVANQGRMQWYKNADGTNSYRAINPSVSLLDTRTGHLLRTLTLGGQVPYALAADARTSRVFVATGPMPPNMPGASGAVRVLDARTGALLRTVALHAIPPLASSQMAVDETTGHVFVALPDYGSPAAPSAVRMLDARTGAMLRSVTVGPESTALLVDRRTHRLLVMNGHTVSMLDTRTGAVVRTLRMDQGLGCVAVDERLGHVFCIVGQDQLLMLDTRSGTLLRTTSVGPTAALAVDATASRALALTQGSPNSHGQLGAGGTVRVLDTRSGVVLRTVRLKQALLLGGMMAPAVAVDEQTGRAFVTDVLRNGVWVLNTRSGTIVRTVTLRPTPTIPRQEAPRAQVEGGDDEARARPH